MKQLNSKFEISRPPPARYTFSGQDLLSCPEEVIAFHVPCMQGEPNRWRLRFKDEWKCDVLHKEGVKPGVVFPIKSRRWIVQMYTQYEVGPPSQRESIQRRLCWFEKCLDELVEFMEDEGLNRVAMPAFIGSTSKTQRSWSPYRQVLEEWHEKHPQIVVVLYNY